MITISDGILTIPESQRFVGFTGDNRHTLKKFYFRTNPESGWLYRLYLTFDDGRHNFFTLPEVKSKEGNYLEWNVQEDHILKSGIVRAQIKAFSDENEVYHTTSDVFIAGKTAEEDEEFMNSNSEFLYLERALNELYEKMRDASAKMPYVGENGNWFCYDVHEDSYSDSGVSSMFSIKDYSITPEKFDRHYWQRLDRINVTGYDYLDSMCSDKYAAGTAYRVEFSGLSPIKDVVGDGSFLGLVDVNNSTMLLLNITNCKCWTYTKGSSALVPYVPEIFMKDGSVAPRHLDRTYWQKSEVVNVTGYDYFDSFLNQENSENTIFRIGFSGLSPIKSVVGHGSFVAIISSDSSYLTLTNIYNGEMFRYDAGSYTLTKLTASDGQDGYTPIKGIDYFTKEELDDIKAENFEHIETELAKRGQLKPEFANSIDECENAAKLYVLPDGYIYGFMLTEVSKNPSNLLHLATDTDRTTLYNGKGFKENTRLSSSGGTGDAAGIFATGFIPACEGDVLYFSNISWSNLSQKCYIIAYNSSNAVTGKLEIQATSASPAPTSPLTLDSATFGTGFNAIRISASDISADTIITVNEPAEGTYTKEYGWKNTGHAFVPADYEERIIDLEADVESLKEAQKHEAVPLVEFDFDHNLVDVSAMVSGFQVASHDLRKQKTVPTVYSLFDSLAANFPEYVSKSDAAEVVGLTYPAYANGITTAGTYAVTPAYKTYMYKLSYNNAYSGNSGRHKRKKMLLIGGLDGSEYVPPYNLYILAKRLCEDFSEDSNLFKLRSSFDIYIVPCLNGYGLYHGTKYNANGIAITRNMPTKAWAEADSGDPNYYTGSVAGSEFETQLIMKLTEYIKPDMAIDHHSYGYLPTQFYSELPKEDFVRLAYQSLVDCSMAFTKDLPQYFGTDFKLFQDREGATSAPAQVANVRGTQTWWNENGVTFGGLIEASVGINYLNGQPAGEGQDLYGNSTFSVAEYTLRNQLLRYADYVLMA